MYTLFLIYCSLIYLDAFFKLPNNCYKTRYGDTKEACGIAAGAAALVLEKLPNYTPKQVKLVNEATDGAINMLQLFPKRRAETPNKLLYIGSDDKCVGKLLFNLHYVHIVTVDIQFSVP